ncbi:MAG TPA: hypothetical protein VGE25_02930 [Sediminibacterium sp.]
MNTKSLNEIKEKFASLLTETSEEEGIEHDSYMLMAGFLSEIERVQKQKRINRKNLSQIIKTSSSYLTQVFRGDKPLNFATIAKIQRALNIRFEISAHYKDVLIENAFRENQDVSDLYRQPKFKSTYLYKKYQEDSENYLVSNN